MPTAPAYTDEFRRQAVEMLVTEKLSVTEVARRLGVDAKTLRKWLKKYRPAPGTAAPAPAAPPSAEHELRRLREENRQLKMERDILKKAAIYLAQPPD